ncbi:GntR family transcriptional regulator [Alteromonas sp. KUL49]|nr:GntR family transcriptional regulator [Alteromonas sp. KUL49]
MQIMVDIDSDVPLFTQLTDQIKSAIASDTLLPGAKLPSIRQLANDLDLNNKTVAKAYRLLERDAVIQSKGYRGTFVHPDAKQNCGQDINDWISAEVQKLVGVLREGGATDSEIRIAFTNAMNK